MIGWSQFNKSQCCVVFLVTVHHHSIEYSHPLEVWDAEEDLHNCAEVATVAQVFDACVTRTEDRLQLHARLLDHLPLTDPRPCAVVCVVPILCLEQRRGEIDVRTFILVWYMWILKYFKS